jgi:hypothetical protein
MTVRNMFVVTVRYLSIFCHLIFVVNGARFVPFFLAIKRQSSFFGVAVNVIVKDVLNKMYRNNMLLDSQNISPSFLEVLVSVTVRMNFPVLKELGIHHIPDFKKKRKATDSLVMSLCPSFYMSTCSTVPPTEKISSYLLFSVECLDVFQFWLESGKIMDSLYEAFLCVHVTCLCNGERLFCLKYELRPKSTINPIYL